MTRQTVHRKFSNPNSSWDRWELQVIADLCGVSVRRFTSGDDLQERAGRLRFQNVEIEASFVLGERVQACDRHGLVATQGVSGWEALQLSERRCEQAMYFIKSITAPSLVPLRVALIGPNSDADSETARQLSAEKINIVVFEDGNELAGVGSTATFDAVVVDWRYVDRLQRSGPVNRLIDRCTGRPVLIVVAEEPAPAEQGERRMLIDFCATSGAYPTSRALLGAVVAARCPSRGFSGSGNV